MAGNRFFDEYEKEVQALKQELGILKSKTEGRKYRKMFYLTKMEINKQKRINYNYRNK